MPGQRTVRWREHVVNCARLLGYSFERPPAASLGGTTTWASSVHAFKDGIVVKENRLLTNLVSAPMLFRFPWKAAVFCLKLEGVDAAKLVPPRKNGDAGSSAPEALLERNQEERRSAGARKAARNQRRARRNSRGRK